MPSDWISKTLVEAINKLTFPEVHLHSTLDTLLCATTVKYREANKKLYALCQDDQPDTRAKGHAKGLHHALCKQLCRHCRLKFRKKFADAAAAVNPLTNPTSTKMLWSLIRHFSSPGSTGALDLDISALKMLAPPVTSGTRPGLPHVLPNFS